MADNIENITLDILKKIQPDIARIGARFARVDERFDRVDEQLRKVRRDYAGMMVMARAVSGDFDQRVNEIEERVTALEMEGKRPD